MGRIFEQGADVDPVLTHRVASGLAGNTTKNHTWQKIVTWLTGQLRTSLKIVTEQYSVNIGVWNMDSTASVDVAHGLADYTKIRSIDFIIYPDSGTNIDHSKLIASSTGLAQVGISSITPTIIQLNRYTGGYFDDYDFSSAVINRGKIIIFSEPQ